MRIRIAAAILLAVVLSGTAKAYAYPYPVLRGAAEYSDRIAPVKSDLQPGLIFNPDKLSVISSRNVWYRVPAWFAGTWHKAYEILDDSTNCGNKAPRTLVACGDEHVGWQQDRSGGIWEYSCNYIQQTDTDSCMVYHFVDRCDLVSETPNCLVFELQSTDVRVRKGSMEIQSVGQSISTEKLTLLADGRTKVESLRRGFDAEGNPLRKMHSTSEKERIAEFSPIDEYQGRDVRALFRRYLMSTGRLDLVPAESSISSAVSR